ncbi:GAF domain-containing protein [Solirubrobacter ginsenosidimutans]|uniref:histidine kinase n=1 Tax=Solirubrobacter ginsenosidimutans TaxID=490573 RepID=A0A9X3MWL5_9ACTN|nr:GAF domain-containing protein [Solirubrobacter ginsenosidimutans]MDA0162622.1 GAF domain-containing protein [Solirubrobacter ginsenosidimutans]
MSAPRSSGAGRERVPSLLERQDSGYLWFLESLDALHRSLQGTSDLGEALDAALGVVVEVLAGDRAWLLELHAGAWTPVMERTRPEYPGGLDLGVRQPFTPEATSVTERLLDSDWSVQIAPEHVSSLTLGAGVTPPRAVLAMAIYPKVGASWIFGMHQCSHARTWTAEEERLFVEIGHRLADALTSLIAYRDVRESARKLAQAGHVARLGYWERDVATFEVNYSQGTYEIFGLSPGAHTLAPAQLAERLHPDDRKIMVEAYERAVAGGPRYDVDYRVLHPGAEIRYVHSEADITWDADGRPLRMFGVMQDITERKQAEERLIRYRDSLERLAREQEALRRVATLVARATSPEEIFASVTREVGRLLGVDLAVLGRYDAATETIVAGWTANGDFDATGRSTALGGRNVSTIVHDTRRPVRFEDYGEATGEIAEVRRAWGVRAIVGVPIIVEGEIRGVMAVASRTDSPLPPDAEERLASFTELLATAYANAEARAALRHVADEQATLRRVATRVARGEPPEEVFAAIAKEVAGLFATASSSVVRFLPEGVAEAVGSWTGDRISILGARTSLSGHNISALVFASGRPARIDRYQEETDPTAAGRRIETRCAVGVPITVNGRLWGTLAVGTAGEQSLPADVEHRLASFGDLAATAIANAEAREALGRVADEQAALRRVATLVARGTGPDLVFAAVAEEVGTLLPAAELALVGRYLPDGSIEYVGAWSALGGAEWLGTRVRVGGHNVSTLVFETRQPGRVDHLGEEASEVTELARASGARSSAGAPIEVEGRLWGAMIVASIHEAVLPPDIEHELAAFTELIATAIANAEARAELTASRARLVTSADETRRRIVRDLHDGAQSRLVQTTITLGLARRAQDHDDGVQARELMAEALDQAQRANRELRDLVQGILPSDLARSGLAPAVEELIDRVRVPVTLDVTAERFRPEIEANAYFLVAEALTNIAKHSGAEQASVRVWVEDALVHVEVRDDGSGGARPEGGGLRGLADRIEALGGRLTIDSPRSGGTRITAVLPQ